MTAKFFADYDKFIVVPADENHDSVKTFNPQEFATHYILTLSLFDSLLQKWSDADKYEIDIEKSIDNVLKEFNKSQRKMYYLQLLEFDKEKPYFVLALSSRIKPEDTDDQGCVSYVVEKLLSNPFYIGERWYVFIGDRGRIERRIFRYSYKEYIV
ncbi:hypothetical protein [Peribacillus kribbensis]|uniref:hypothetical protein n=1 Tax=Peribacillus kribbensis TaxID=356658 RepID=UPI0004141B9B|nr:hypothetical protein [Peribacillus kribbensis]